MVPKCDRSELMESIADPDGSGNKVHVQIEGHRQDDGKWKFASTSIRSVTMQFLGKRQTFSVDACPPELRHYIEGRVRMQLWGDKWEAACKRKTGCIE